MLWQQTFSKVMTLELPICLEIYLPSLIDRFTDKYFKIYHFYTDIILFKTKMCDVCGYRQM